VRNTVPETSIKAAAGFVLSVSLAVPCAFADEPPCPDTTPAVGAPQPPKPRAESADDPITIQSDDDNFEFDVNGNARMCGNVEMSQGDRHIRADCLEYNAREQSARLQGGIEYADPTLVVRGNDGTYSPTLGASFQGTEFELPERGARGAARSL
jgi:lipopolysaccharide assembly outer membrane protein LptD (OstA)